MDAYKIVQLIGACIAMIVGTIVFMVLFFRSMSWIDLWIKSRSGADLKRARSKKKRSSALQQMAPNEARRSEASRQANGQRVRKDARSLANVPVAKGKFASRLAAAKQKPLAEVQSETQSDVQSDAQSDVQTVVQNASDTENLKEAACLATKSRSRIATVHLLSGETIERVGFCSKEKASKICDGLGFEGIVFENVDGQISVVRECNIKLVTWKAV